MDDSLSPNLIPVLAARIRRERLERGWDLAELARRAEVSRTTLYHLEKGHTRKLRTSTVKAIADAFQIPGESLTGGEPALPNPIPSFPLPTASVDHFDRATNPAIAEVARERPTVFQGWTNQEWDELYSQFGVGGALTPLGVLSAAEAMNQKRETIRQLHVVLDTHLRDAARAVIETFYQMVQAKAPPRKDGAEPG